MSDDLLPEEERQKRLSALDALSEFSEMFTSAMKQIEEDSEAYWNSLTKEQQLDAFCAVSRRIHKGEIELKGSYRYVLYDVFGFGPEAYASAQMSGYLDIHNSFISEYHEKQLLEDFCKKYDIEDAENKIKEFML